MAWAIYPSYSSPRPAPTKRPRSCGCTRPRRRRTTYEVLQISKGGTTWHGAVQRTPKPGHEAKLAGNGYELAEDGSHVFASVIPTFRQDGE